MITLLSEPQLKLEGSSWTLLLWVCEPFTDEYSFRELFAKITAVLNRERDVSLMLPPEEPGEDFVDGTLRWGPTAYDVYFERSLGYLQFSSTSESSTRELLDALAAAPRLVARNGKQFHVTIHALPNSLQRPAAAAMLTAAARGVLPSDTAAASRQVVGRR